MLGGIPHHGNTEKQGKEKVYMYLTVDKYTCSMYHKDHDMQLATVKSDPLIQLL